MHRLILNITICLYIILFSIITGCGIYQNDLVEIQNDFGIRCAKMGLWNEAIIRWRRVIEIEPNNAKIHNNIAVAYESIGELENALVRYKTAMELEPENKIYKSNYIRFKRNYDRMKKIKDEDSKIQDAKAENSEIQNKD